MNQYFILLFFTNSGDVLFVNTTKYLWVFLYGVVKYPAYYLPFQRIQKPPKYFFPNVSWIKPNFRFIDENKAIEKVFLFRSTDYYSINLL